jgi:hypothetical protein
MDRTVNIPHGERISADGWDSWTMQRTQAVLVKDDQFQPNGRNRSEIGSTDQY